MNAEEFVQEWRDARAAFENAQAERRADGDRTVYAWESEAAHWRDFVDDREFEWACMSEEEREFVRQNVGPA